MFRQAQHTVMVNQKSWRLCGLAGIAHSGTRANQQLRATSIEGDNKKEL